MSQQDYTEYENPLSRRYASPAMRRIFSPQFKFGTWRRLWIALAESQRELGLAVTEEQVTAMRAVAEQIDFAAAEARERETRHDVMSHIHAFAAQAPEAAPIIHLGATSAFVGDNTDLIQMRRALELVLARLLEVIRVLAKFAGKYRKQPILGFTLF